MKNVPFDSSILINAGNNDDFSRAVEEYVAEELKIRISTKVIGCSQLANGSGTVTRKRARMTSIMH